jgi:hypothetical protein
MSRKPPKHTDPRTLSRPADPPAPQSQPPTTDPGLVAAGPSPESQPAAAPQPVKLSCATCTYGQDTALAGQRRCRAQPPQAHYLSRFFGTDQSSGVHALAMWPQVKDDDHCGAWEPVDAA